MRNLYLDLNLTGRPQAESLMEPQLGLIQQTGSGTRYSAPEIDFWEHHGEATVTWRGTKLIGKVLH